MDHRSQQSGATRPRLERKAQMRAGDGIMRG
jgi:hypothetical protein